MAVAREALATPFGRQLQVTGTLFLLAIILTGVTGWFCCFWPGKHPTRRVMVWVCLPAITGFALMLGRLLYLTKPYSSVFEIAGYVTVHANWVAYFWKLPAGFHICALGILLVLTFASRMAFGIATLPLALPIGSIPHRDDIGAWRRMQVLIWVLVGALVLPYSLLIMLAVGIPVMFFSKFVSAYLQSPWSSRVASILELLPLAFAIRVVGKEDRHDLRTVMKVPRFVYLVVAFAIPVGIAALISIGQYSIDRAMWAAHEFGALEPPKFWSYLALPNPWLFLLFFSACLEEVIFRGLLQRRLLERYGLYRGIFLVGMVWSAFHFFSDFSSGVPSERGVLSLLVLRITMCIAHSFVFGWLVLRSRSLFPAAIAHTLYNVFVHSPLGPVFPGVNAVQLVLWGLLAIALFRLWPVDTEAGPLPDDAGPIPLPSGR